MAVRGAGSVSPEPSMQRATSNLTLGWIYAPACVR